MLWGDTNSRRWDEGIEPITIPTKEAEVGWGVLMVQIYIGSLHKFFGSNFSWQLNNLGSLIPDCLWEVKLCLCGDIIYFNYYKLQKLWVPSKMQGHSHKVVLLMRTIGFFSLFFFTFQCNVRVVICESKLLNRFSSSRFWSYYQDFLCQKGNESL